MGREIIFASLLLIDSPVGASAQGCPGISPQAATAIRVSEPIVMDGRLSEDVWTKALPLGKFYENFPGACKPASENSEARFLYDDRYLYVGLRANLRDITQLRKPFVRRDKVNATHDYMQVYIDPIGTRRTAYFFRVNARGVKTDGLNDEGKGSESTAPDFDWEVRTARDAQGWTAELRIPLSTLRLSRRGRQEWTVLVTRGVPRSQNTQMATAPLPHDSNCFLCVASTLEFADMNPRTEHLIVSPSVVTGARRDRGSYGTGDHYNAQPSLDVKWLPYTGAAVDLTVKPDFSQVEADSPQLTANQRFAINLPEKRPFFREGSDLIGTPLPVLYTRTISAPDFGARFTHRSTRLNGTIFIARDGGRGAIIEPGLLSSDIGLPDFRSEVGFVHVVEGVGAAQIGELASAKIDDDGSYNAVGGVDGTWRRGTNRFSGQLLYSDTRNPNRPDLLDSWRGQHRAGAAALLEWSRSDSTLVSTVRYTRYDSGFRSWLGYVPRVGYQEGYLFLQRPWYPKGLLNSVSPYVSIDMLKAVGAPGHERDPAVGVQATGPRNLNVDISYRPDTIVLTEQGSERHTSSLQWTAFLNPLPSVPLFQLNGLVGRQVDFATGEVVAARSIAATLRARPSDRLELEGRYTRSDLGDAPGGGNRLHESIREILATWYFGPAFYVLADAQFYSTHRRFPDTRLDRSSLTSIQASWEISPKLQTYFGVRSGAQHPETAVDQGRSTEVYFKLSRRFGL